MIKKTDFCGYDCYTVSSNELSVSVLTLGAICHSVEFHGQSVALFCASAAEYLAGSSYIGAIVGRYANRIAQSRFTLNGKTYCLPANEGPHHLHGGPNAFDRRRWTAEILDESAVKLTLLSPDGDNGYPGTLRAAVTYRVEGAALRLDFEGESDADTVFAPSTHIYWNLGGGATVLDSRLQIAAEEYLEVDGQLIPTCKRPVEGTAFDFRSLRPIRQGYDHCFVLSGNPACTAESGGLRMTLSTDAPGLQVYTGEFLEGRPYGGLALEPAALPNSPNRPDFPSPILRKNERFHQYICYQFEAVQPD